MAINYNWVISQLECKAQEGNLTDVVFIIHYRYQANETDGDKSYFAEVYGTVSCPNPDPEHFTAYVDFADVVFNAAVTARCALIYNDTVVGKPSIAVLDFGSDNSR